jgi:hypothetical protein
VASAICKLASIAIDRGDPERARALLADLPGDPETGDFQQRATALTRRQLQHELDGSLDAALADVVAGLALMTAVQNSLLAAEQLADAARYASETGEHDAALAATASVDTVPHTRALDSQLYRIRANAAAAAGDETAAAEAYGIALANARNLGYAYWLAPVLYDYGRWLAEIRRSEEGRPLLEESRALFEQMGATRWLERIDALGEAERVPTIA